METRDKKDKTCCPDFTDACKGFQGMFEEMMKHWADKGDFTDCSAMMDSMREKCCGPKTGDTKKGSTGC